MPLQHPFVAGGMSPGQRSCGEHRGDSLTLFLFRPRRLPWLLPDLSPSLPPRWVSLLILDDFEGVRGTVEGGSDVGIG